MIQLKAVVRVSKMNIKLKHLNKVEKQMSILSNLKLTTAKKPTSVSPLLHRRYKLSKRIWEQIELAKAQKVGETFTTKKFKSIKDINGITRSVEMDKRVRQWWFVSDNGKVCLNIRYGAKVIELAKGKTAIEVANADELIRTLELVKSAVEGGELDAQIESVSGALREGFIK
jgi:hypothetical protein